MFQMSLPKEVREILFSLEEAEYTAYVVGGAVRDAVMGKEPHDFDICTSALPDQMKKVFFSRRVIETGLQHGTLTVLGEADQYEITTYRIDGDYADARHPDGVRFVDNIKEDLARRDFTVNAMAYNETAGLLDPFGGVEDVKARLIRCVGDPEKRLTEDALRILRGVRFAVQCGFSLEERTHLAMMKHRFGLEKVSEERKTAELCRFLPRIDANALTAYRDILAVFIPELSAMFGFEQKNDHHKFDVWEHTVHAVCMAPEDLILRLALLFHDIGKPACFTTDENGVGHFYDHAKIGSEMTERILRRMKFDTATVRTVTDLVLHHGVVPHTSMKFARRFLARHGEENARRLLVIARCDILAQAEYDGRADALQRLQALGENIDMAIREAQCFTVRDLAVNGNDLIALGVPAGKEVGRLLALLLDAVLEEPSMNERENLLRIAREQKGK